MRILQEVDQNGFLRQRRLEFFQRHLLDSLAIGGTAASKARLRADPSRPKAAQASSCQPASSFGSGVAQARRASWARHFLQFAERGRQFGGLVRCPNLPVPPQHHALPGQHLSISLLRRLTAGDGKAKITVEVEADRLLHGQLLPRGLHHSGRIDELAGDLQRLAVKRLGPRVVALVLVQPGQIVQAGGIIGVVLPEDLLPDLQGLTAKRLGPRVVALALVQPGQIVQAGGIIGVVLPEGLLRISRA